MSTGFNFDPRQHKPATEGRELFAEGWYLGYIKASNANRNQAGTGGMLALDIFVQQGGGEEGETYLHNLNCWNPNQQAVEIAFRDLSAICWVVGKGQEIISQVGQAKDMAVPSLHNIPFYFRVTVDPRKDRQTRQIIPGQFQNQIRGYRDQYGRTPDQIMAGAPQQQPPELAVPVGTQGTTINQGAPSLPPAPPTATGMPGAAAPMPTAQPAPMAAQPGAFTPGAPPAPPPAAPQPPAMPPGYAPAPVAPAPQPMPAPAAAAPAFPGAAPTTPAAPAAPTQAGGWTPGAPPGQPNFAPPGT